MNSPAVDVVVFSHVVIDDIRLPTGEHHEDLLGGAGAYAAAGASLVTGRDRTGVVSGIGDDFPTSARQWLRDAGIDDAGMTVVHPNTPTTRIQYLDDGEREEVPAFGSAHFALSEPTFLKLPERYQYALGLYVFKPVDDAFWIALSAYRRRTDCRVLWEIDASACTPDARPDVLRQLREVDLLSINETELRDLFIDHPGNTTDERVQSLLASGVREVILRQGSRGASVHTSERVISAAPVPMEVVDPTGAGNAFSGAYLASWIHHVKDSKQSLADGMAAAAMVIEQYGPPPFTKISTTRFRSLSREIRGLITHHWRI